MKTIAFCSILLLTSCASSTGVVDKRAFNCDSGQDIEVRAGLDDPLHSETAVLGQVTFLVEIANNADHELTVDTISIDPVTRVDMELKGVSTRFNQAIPSADDHVFRLAASDFGKILIGDERTLPRNFQFRVTVRLTNGDTYRCPFDVGRPQ